MIKTYKIHVIGTSKNIENALGQLGEVKKEKNVYTLSREKELSIGTITEITFMPEVCAVLERNIRFIK